MPLLSNPATGIQPISELLSNVLPKDFGDVDATQQVQAKMAKLDPKFQKVALTVDPNNPDAPLVPIAPEIKVPEIKPVLVEPIVDTPREVSKNPVKSNLGDDLPEPSFGDKLLEALEDKISEVKEIPTAPVKDVLDGKLPETKSEEIIPETLPAKGKDAQAAFAKMAKLLKEKEHKIKELEAKGSVDVAASATEPLRQQIAQLESQRNDILNSTATIKLEARPEIQERYIKPMQTAEAYIRDVAKVTEGLNARALLDAANEPDRMKRVAAVRAECTDMHPNDALRVEQAVDAIHILGTDLNSLRSNAAEINKKFEIQQQQQLDSQRAAFRSEANKAIDRRYDEFVKTDKVLAHFMEQDPKIKEQVGKVLDLVKKFDSDFSWAENHETRATALLQGLSYPIMKKVYQNALKQYVQEAKDLKAQNLKLKNAGISTIQRNNTYTAPKSDEPQSLKGIIGDAFKGTVLA